MHLTLNLNLQFSGDFKQAYEVREGDITRGAYSVLQPDGVVRTVRYTVDPKGGFKASVTNTGLGYHPRRVY
ncbi:Adult-specific cuticular protein ACP-20 [Orchesella cincta]|uniref:Adult-specific cuticular protein ACP-20 n=1 Tax=Orchesella cincta TaxID=48709 RepID=A0A1D2NGU3_ORCCI|nr:Adult-specific cuticular protein ACP-20 [Orchesella cincta]